MTAPTGCTSTRPGLAAEVARPARPTSAVSVTGSVLAIASTAVKPPSAAAAVPVRDGLGVLAARLAQVGVQVDEAGQRDQAVGVDDLGAGVGARSPTSAITPSSTSRSAGVAAEQRGRP